MFILENINISYSTLYPYQIEINLLPLHSILLVPYFTLTVFTFAEQTPFTLSSQ